VIVIGIDQSKRSTAVTALDEYGDLFGFCLINPPLYYDGEKLINYQWEKLSSFLDSMPNDEIVIALEGAAFAAGGASSDLLWGIQWYIRTRIHVEFPGVPIGIITPATWRSKILPASEQREWKAKCGGKIGLKHGVVAVTPEYIRLRFEAYLEGIKAIILVAKGKEPDSRSKVYKECLFDLCDSWGIAQHRLSLTKKTAKFVPAPAPKMSNIKRRFPNAQ
jgi:hypothetical protein